ncbi:holo-ACP synthase [Buchnera aphidicola (Ceratovacuna keduensis)]|uniref:holo-ACP synthase n=1 Tax=Buchnera aphidicola TaxID=9 RepID=UPI0031B83E4B
MSIIGIGIDIIKKSRIEKIKNLFKNKFAKKILHKLEFKKYKFSKDKIKFLTKRFSVKEAFVKSLGIGIRNGISFKDLKIYNNNLGKPKIKVFKKTLKFLKKNNVIQIHISISHEKKYFCSMVILEN